MKRQTYFCIGQIAILFLSLVSSFFQPQPILAESESDQAIYYIVFEKYGDDTIAPVYYRPVELTAPLQSVSTKRLNSYLAQPPRMVKEIVVMLQAIDGSIVYQNVVEVPYWLRGEFHGAEADDPIDGHLLPAENRAFVVRVPRIKGTTLIMKDARLTTIARFDLN